MKKSIAHLVCQYYISQSLPQIGIFSNILFLNGMSVKRLLCTAAVIVEGTRSNNTELLRLSATYGWISVKLTVVTGLISVYIVKSAPIKSSRGDFARCGARKKGSVERSWETGASWTVPPRIQEGWRRDKYISSLSIIPQISRSRWSLTSCVMQLCSSWWSSPTLECCIWNVRSQNKQSKGNIDHLN